MRTWSTQTLANQLSIIFIFILLLHPKYLYNQENYPKNSANLANNLWNYHSSVNWSSFQTCSWRTTNTCWISLLSNTWFFSLAEESQLPQLRNIKYVRKHRTMKVGIEASNSYLNVSYKRWEESFQSCTSVTMVTEGLLCSSIHATCVWHTAMSTINYIYMQRCLSSWNEYSLCECIYLCTNAYANLSTVQSPQKKKKKKNIYIYIYIHTHTHSGGQLY